LEAYITVFHFNGNSMSEQELPPWLREQLSRLQQLQQNLQAIMMQKQQVELEIVETDRALEELRKLEGDNPVYKGAGPLLIKANKDDVLKELEEKKELSNTRLTVLGKQETRVKDNLKEVENKINTMIRQMQAGAASGGIGGPGFGTAAGGQNAGASGGGFGTRPQGQ
jgi:prefoldin beta subunit